MKNNPDRKRPKSLVGRFSPWTFGLLSVILIIGVPIFLLLLNSVQIFLNEGLSGSLSHVFEYLLWDYTKETLHLLLLTGLFSLIFALVPALLLAFYDLPFKRTLYWLNILPLTIPTYIAGYIWAETFAYPNTGYQIINNLFGYTDILDVFPLSVIFASVLYPYIFAQLYQAFTSRVSAYRNISNSLGAGLWHFVKKVAIPITLYPALYGLMLVWFETLNDYGAVKYFGVKTFTSAIFKLWYGMGDLGSALIFSSALISLVILIKVLISAFRVQSTLSEKNSTLSNRKRSLAYTVFALVMPLFSFVLPTCYALYNYISSSDVYLIDTDILNGSIFNTAIFSFSGALLIIVISVIIAYSLYHQKLDIHKGGIAKLLRRLSDLSLSGYAVPGAVTALAVTMFFAEIGGAGMFFIIPLLLAYTIRYSMVGYSTIGADIDNNSGRYSLVGMSLGESRIKSLFRSVLPNASKSIVAAFVLCFIEISKDLPLTLILRDYDTETLATSAYRYANDEQLVRSFPYGLLIIALGIVSILISNKLRGEKH